MKPMAGKFDSEGVYFEETEIKPPDPKRFQKAMFMDRPDLWKMKEKKHKPAPIEQLKLNFHIGGEN